MFILLGNFRALVRFFLDTDYYNSLSPQIESLIPLYTNCIYNSPKTVFT